MHKIFIYTTCLLLLLFVVGCTVTNEKLKNSKNTVDTTQTTTEIVEETTSAEVKISNGLKYKVENGTAIILHYSGQEEKVIIPETIDGFVVTKLEERAFYQHKNMREISIPDSVVSIGSGAFYRCYSLESVKISKNVTELDGTPFFRCSSLKSIDVDDGNSVFADVDGVLYNKDVTKLLVYPEGREEKHFSIPESVTDIDIYAFGYCPYSLETVSIPSNVVDFPDCEMFLYPDKITLIIESGSKAEEHAKAYNLKYKVK